jgi:hypothetical protein
MLHHVNPPPLSFLVIENRPSDLQYLVCYSRYDRSRSRQAAPSHRQKGVCSRSLVPRTTKPCASWPGRQAGYWAGTWLAIFDIHTSSNRLRISDRITMTARQSNDATAPR